MNTKKQKKKHNKSNNNINNPHDQLFKKSLKDLRVAKELAMTYLPKELMKDFHDIKILNTGFISPQFKEFEADVAFEITLKKHAKNRSLFMILHAEHQSIPEEILPLRMWQYMLLLLLDYKKNNQKKPLPVIYPLIIYTGKRPYDKTTSLFELFGDNAALAKKYLINPIPIVDICRMPNSEIRKKQWWGLVEFALKHRNTKRIKAFMQEVFHWLNELEMQQGMDHAKLILAYVMDGIPNINLETFLEESRQFLSPLLGESAMTVAQQLRQQGMQQGMQQGLQQGMQQVAMSMIVRNMPAKLIAELTGLSIYAINALKAGIVDEHR